MSKGMLIQRKSYREAPGFAVEFSPLEPNDEFEHLTDSGRIHVPSGHFLAVQIAQYIVHSRALTFQSGIDLYSDCAWWLMTESEGRQQEWQISNGLIFILSKTTFGDWLGRKHVPLPFTTAEVCHEFLRERGAIDVKWWDVEDWTGENQEWSNSPAELRL